MKNMLNVLNEEFALKMPFFIIYIYLPKMIYKYALFIYKLKFFMAEYSTFFETIFDGYVLLETGVEALKAYLASLKGNQNQKIKYLILLTWKN
jgi:hypothetical protein